MVEAGIVDGRRAESVLRAYLEPLLAAEPEIDTLLLGCTHYPLLRGPIERIVGEAVAVVDSAFTTALAVEDLLDALGARAPDGSTPRHRVATTGSVDAFVGVAARLFGDRLPAVESVEIEPVGVRSRRLRSMARHTARLSAGIVVGGLLALGASVASREIMRRAGTRLIDWEAVREIAHRRLGSAAAPMPGRASAPRRRRSTGPPCCSIEPIVAEEIGSQLPEALETPAVVDRLEWVDLNLATFRVLFERIERTLLEQQEGPDTAGRAMSRWLNRTVGNQQLGFMLAFLGRKVLGQYDVSLLAAGPTRGRLHFVEPNIVGTAATMRIPRDEFRIFIALHEATHAFEFEAHPWLRPYFADLVGRTVESAGGRVGRPDGAHARGAVERRGPLAGADHDPRPARDVQQDPGADVAARGLLEPRHERGRRADPAELHRDPRPVRAARRAPRARSSRRSCA